MGADVVSGDEKNDNEQVYLVMGLTFIVIGTGLLSSSLGAGISFLALGCVWLGLSVAKRMRGR